MSNQQNNFKPETTTVWSFPIRGTWATHKPDYRGNFAPQVVRNIIINYSKEGELVLDPMVGGGTTLIEARMLNRNAIGYDINQRAVDITRQRLDFHVQNNSEQKVGIGDVRNLDGVNDNSIDLIITHPPYLDIIKYSDANPNDLSTISDVIGFMKQLDRGINELHRVLKPDRYCAIQIGDTRKAQHYISLSSYLMCLCLRAGFVLKEDIIKVQHNTSSENKWVTGSKPYKFYLIMHEHIFVLRKHRHAEDLSKNKFSSWNGLKKQFGLNQKSNQMTSVINTISEVIKLTVYIIII